MNIAILSFSSQWAIFGISNVVLATITAVTVAVRNYRSHNPDRLEKSERNWVMEPELKELPPPTDWDQFGNIIAARLEEHDSPWADIDTQQILSYIENDMTISGPTGPWACPGCSHKFTAKVDPCPLCDYKDVDDTTWKAWKCSSCSSRNPGNTHRCTWCGNGFRGGGPYYLDSNGNTVMIDSQGVECVVTDVQDKTVGPEYPTRLHGIKRELFKHVQAGHMTASEAWEAYDKLAED